MPDDLRLARLADTLERIWRLPPARHKPGAFLAVAAMELRPWMSVTIAVAELENGGHHGDM